MKAKLTKAHMSQRILQALWNSDYPPDSNHFEVKRMARRSKPSLEPLYAQAIALLSKEQRSKLPVKIHE